MNYRDRNGHVIMDDDVLWDGQYHWSFTDGKENPENGAYLISCEKGYNHDLSQELFNTMSYVGKHQDCLHLFNCD